MKKLSLKAIVLIMSLFALSGCGDPELGIDIVKHLRNNESGVTLLSAETTHIKRINDKLKAYQMQGEYQFYDGRYRYFGYLGQVAFYEKLNGNEILNYTSNVIASHNQQGWSIIEESFPKLHRERKGKGELTYSELFDDAVKEANGIYRHKSFGTFIYKDEGFDATIQTLINGYEKQFKEVFVRNEAIVQAENDLVVLRENLEEERKQAEIEVDEEIRIEMDEERERFKQAEGLVRLEPEIEESFGLRHDEIVRELVEEIRKSYKNHPKIKEAIEKIATEKTEVAALKKALPIFPNLSSQCQNEHNPLHGKYCSQIEDFIQKYPY